MSEPDKINLHNQELIDKVSLEIVEEVLRALEGLDVNKPLKYNLDFEVAEGRVRVIAKAGNPNYPTLRLVSNSNMDVDLISNLKMVAYDAILSMVSELTNNDACDITIRERSSHFDSHPDLDGLHNDGYGWEGWPIVVDAKVEDYLS